MSAKNTKDSVKMGVYDYVSRDTATHYINGKFVKVKWFSKPRRGAVSDARLVAQELGYGERLDELFAGTPSLGAVVWSWFTQ